MQTYFYGSEKLKSDEKNSDKWHVPIPYFSVLFICPQFKCIHKIVNKMKIPANGKCIHQIINASEK